jgi:hypothetical protein
MDPFTLALATFGIQKLRGKSTRTALKSAAIIGGGAYGLGRLGGVTAFQGSPFSSLGFGQKAAMAPKGTTLGESFLNEANMPKGTPIGTDKFVDSGRYSGIVKSRGGELSGLNVVEPAAKTGINKALDYVKNNKVQSAFLASSVLPLLSEEEEVKPAFTEEDYKQAYKEQAGKLEGAFTPVQMADATPSREEVFGSNMFYANEGGLATAVNKFNKGGVNYLPSKIDHDENDVNNYVRAQGYVEDGAGAGDKDEDTMLAQLADGEFVSRADAVLGAGILSGADPKSFKGMRKAGADFFYNQQKQLKRIYDLTNGSKKEN